MDLDLNMLDALSEEEQSVMNAINDTDTRYEQNITIPELFCRRVAASSELVAVKEGNITVTYNELDKKSNRVAALLRTLNAKPNELIGIVTERGADFISGVLGIMKSGAAYIPIDPHYPGKRIQYMLSDSKCRILITDSKNLLLLADSFPESVNTVICLDKVLDSIKLSKVIFDRDKIEEYDSAPGVMAATANDLAYVIYTSGSTGEPKGVMITHKAILNTIFWLQETFSLTINDVIAQKTSISFTDSVWELFWTLLFGAKLAIMDNDTVRDPKLLYETMKKEEVTVTQFVPAQMSIFVDAVLRENTRNPLPRLKWVFNGGEALFANVAREWYKAIQGAKIANIYGMTESAIYATNYIIHEIPPEDMTGIPLGKPIANTRVYILDDRGRECPFYGKGEICIGGIGITSGYWGKPELTDKVFTVFEKTGDKLYCTGDIGTLRPDGIIEYFGRKDDQVQVRGFRVELKEVEKTITGYCNIKEAAVIAIQDSYGVTNLHCYYTSQKKDFEMDRLVAYLKDILPDYMLPVYYVHLEQMPLTPNGKIDRKKLPEMKSDTKIRSNYFEPRNDKEKRLTEIWSEILNIPVEEIGIHDSFMEIGGNSTSIVRLHQKMKDELGSEVTVAELFSYPTIALYMNNFEYNKKEEKLDVDLENILAQIEGGTLDPVKSASLLDKLNDK